MRRTWWWIFGLFVAVPAVALALLGLRAVRAERIERRQQVRDQQAQIARLADAAISNALAKAEGAVEFTLDSQGLLVFPREKVYFGEFGRKPAWLRRQWPPATRQWIDDAQAAEAQQRPQEAAAVYRRIAAAEPKLRPWAELVLDRLRDPADVAKLQWSRSDALTPSGLPLALVAGTLADAAATLEALRAGRWWLSYDERRFHDEELRRALAQTPDPVLDELAAIDRIVRGRSSGPYLIHGEKAISYSRLRAMLDVAVAPLLSRAPFRAAVRDAQNRVVWGELPGIENAVGLRALPGWDLAFGPAVESNSIDQRRLLWYGFVTLPIILLMFGLALTARIVRREVELSRLQSEFLAAVTHEFKSPITSIRLLLERIVSGRFPAPGSPAGYLEAIGRETDRLERLVNRVLETQKIQAGQRKYNLVPASIVEIAEAAVQRLRPQAEAQSIAVSLEAPPGIPELPLDRGAISDAVENLLDNAIKYSPSGARVVVSIQIVDGQVWVAVTDEGIGIEKEDLPRVFDKFYRGRRGDRHDVRGTGLGLALVKAAAEGHGGKVAVTSAPGKGSRFCLQLPVENGAHGPDPDRR